MAKEELRQRAIRLLAQRDHSRAELTRKLSSHGSADEVAEVVARMAALELQSDRRFAEQYVRSRGARFGAQRLRRELRQRGIDDELGARAIADALEGDEIDRAQRVWQARFGDAPHDPKEWARQARFLQYRGFSADIIHTVLKGRFDEPA
ncbi:MAG: recombination regulator RecX [Rhodocyclaceae bacterium]|nr:recombination regulator RecX [Rhodocyclaceae bacterium]